MCTAFNDDVQISDGSKRHSMSLCFDIQNHQKNMTETNSNQIKGTSNIYWDIKFGYIETDNQL